LFRCKDFEEISSKSLHFEKKQSLLFLDKRIETMSEFVKSVGFDEWQGLRPANKPHRGLFSRHYIRRETRALSPRPAKKEGRGSRWNRVRSRNVGGKAAEGEAQAIFT